MKGHVPTPDDIAEKMVRRLFADGSPDSSDRILYPGCGTAPFAAAVERVCDLEGWERPKGLGVETNPEHLAEARSRELTHVDFQEQDFLGDDVLDAGQFDYIVGNPPYVPIERLDEDEKRRYKKTFSTAIERFDLYLLFFERALDMLSPNGILSFITPEKFEYVDTAVPLRRLLTKETVQVEEIEHIGEESFSELVTFPCITTVRKSNGCDETVVSLRDGSKHTTTLPADGESWASNVRNANVADMHTGATLDDVTVRISAGVATGADSVFVMNRGEVPTELDSDWIRRTVSGRQLRENDGPYTNKVFVCPYDDDGSLPDEDELGAFGEWAKQLRNRLENRSCVENGKKWYSWHENPPMQDLLQPKIVFRDIAKEPKFWPEKEGDVVPKHSVYYLVPKEGVPFDELLEYLNSSEARMWMEANCQRAANGFYRFQSRVLQDLPVPVEWSKTYQATL